MDRKYRHSLMLICILAVFCLLAADQTAFFQTDTGITENEFLLTVSAEEEQEEAAQYLTNSEPVSIFSTWAFTGPVRPYKRSGSLSVSGAAVTSVLVSRRYFLYVPKEERFFACFQPAIFLCARFLRELLILFKKDGKNGELFLHLDIIL